MLLHLDRIRHHKGSELFGEYGKVQSGIVDETGTLKNCTRGSRNPHLCG